MTIETPYGEMPVPETANALSASDVQEIVRRYFDGKETETEIARSTGRTKNAVSKIISQVFRLRSFPHAEFSTLINKC